MQFIWINPVAPTNAVRDPQLSSSLRVAEYRESQARAVRLKGGARREALKQLRRTRRQLVSSFSEATLRLALNGEDRCAESLVWFWFNHFNVFWRKDLVGAALPDYVEGVIRPHVRGRFRDLLMGCLTHPAMLVYLDNTRNVAGRLNENLARELLELHTLGVDGGYTQADVRETARILTGLGLRPVGRPTKSTIKGTVSRGEFMFDPRRHEGGSKQVLGHRMTGSGYGEVEALVDFLAQHPATAQHVARKLSVYLLGDEPPTGCVTRAASVFEESRGDIGKTISSILQYAGSSKDDGARTFKDPHRFIISAVRLLAAGRPLADCRPLTRWLANLGQPLFGRRTPDGYSLHGRDWISAGQLTQRFELAREMVNVVPRLVDGPLSTQAILKWPETASHMAALGPASRRAVEKARIPEQRLILLLSSPEFMYWQAGPCEQA